MKHVYGVIGVVYKRRQKGYRVAVLERVAQWHGWELVKGRLQENESYEDAIAREVREETNIETILSLDQLPESVSWTFRDDNGERVYKEHVPFLVEVPAEAQVSIAGNADEEHRQGFFLNVRDAHDILQFSEQKAILQQAKEYWGMRT